MIRAVGFRLLIKKDEIETETESGIVIVQNEKLEKHAVNTGTVVGIGEKAFKAYSTDYSGEPWVREGDQIIFSRHAGVTVVDPYTDEEFTLLNDDDVAAVISKG